MWKCEICSHKNINLRSNKCDLCGSKANTFIFHRQNSNQIDEDDYYPSLATATMTSLKSLVPSRGQESKNIHKIYLNSIDEAKTMTNNIVEFCRLNNIDKFVDDSFPPCDKSLFSHEESRRKVFDKFKLKSIQWLTPNDIKVKHEYRKFKWTVYETSPSSNDIKQGCLGNCWFLSALAVLCEKPEMIKQILISEKYSPEGCYLIRLCHHGEWKTVLIDDLFPCDESDQLLYSKAHKRQLWVALIEKALAKLNKSYEALIAGHTIEGLATLTGYSCESISFANDEIDQDEKELNWATLLSSIEAGFAIGTACNNQKINENEFEKCGLVSNHAYSVLDVKVINGVRLLQIRNPWGHKSWNGDWSNNSNLWTPRIRNEFKTKYKKEPFLTTDDNGIFWISYDDFTKYFYCLDICKIRSNWMEARMTGYFASTDCRDTLSYTLHAFETTEMEISLFQRSDMSRKDIIDSDLLLLVFQQKLPHLPFVTSSKRLNKRVVNFDYMFGRGEYAIIPLSFNFWYTSNKVSYNLALHGSKPFLLEQNVIPYHILSDAVISFAIATGRKWDDDRLFLVTKNFNGILIVANNIHKEKYYHVEINAEKSLNMVSTRNSLVTHDSVPPGYRQILMLLSKLESSEGYSLDYKYSGALKKDQCFNYDDQKNIMNFPKLNRKTFGLHAPRRIQA